MTIPGTESQRLPEFQAEYLQVRRDLMSQASGRLQYHAGTLISVGLKLIGENAVVGESQLDSGLYRFGQTRQWKRKTC